MPNCNCKEFLFWILRLRRRYRVVGASMQPSLNAGDELLVDARAYRHTAPGVGEIVVARHPEKAELLLIKRITGKTGDGRYLLAGDNPDPEQSDSYSVPARLILGRVTSQFA